MHRLLQGDVGSGKTVVAVGAMLAAVQGGHQGALMAPTEVLADQHFLAVRALRRRPGGAGPDPLGRYATGRGGAPHQPGAVARAEPQSSPISRRDRSIS